MRRILQKNLILFLALSFLFSIQSIEAQSSDDCNTPTPDYSEVMSAREVNQILSNRNTRAGSNFIVRVRFHRISDDAGSWGPSEADILAQVAIMNANYLSSGIQFDLQPTNMINNTAWASVGDPAYEALTEFTLYPMFGATTDLDIFVYPTESGDKRGNAFAIPNDFLAMTEGRFGNSQNLSHEIGHTLNLLHTHERWGATNADCPTILIEDIDGTNCLTGGDLCCDTAADPQLGSNWNTGTCSYTNPGTEQDCQANMAYIPPGTNYMSYGWSCRTMFSPCQVLRMEAFLCTPQGAMMLSSCGMVVTCPPADLGIITCNDAIPTAANDEATFTALTGTITAPCGPVTVAALDVYSPPADICNGRTMTRTYTVSDLLTSSMCVQTLTITAPTAPTIVCPPPVGTPVVPAKPLASGAIVTTDCGLGYSTVVSDPVVVGDGCIGTTFTFTYTTTDACGRVASCEQVFTLTEDVLPDIGHLGVDDQINISMGSDCYLEVTSDLFLEGDYGFGCLSALDISISGLPSNIVTECGTYIVTITDPISGNSGWATIVVEDKLPPISTDNPCPVDQPCPLSCLDPNYPVAHLTQIKEGFEDCTSPLDLDFRVESEVIPGECDEADLLIVWVYATDEKGNIGADALYYDLIKLPGNQVYCPDVYEGECGDLYAPSDLYAEMIDPLSDHYNIPLVPWFIDPILGQVFIHDLDSEVDVFESCNLIVKYSDMDIPLCGGAECGGSKKVIRTWFIIDWCVNRTYECTQLLHLKDTTPPVVHNDEWLDVSVDPWLCTVDKFELPAPVGWDNCTIDGQLTFSIYDYNGLIEVVYDKGKWYALNMPKGLHEFIYTATDCCGNISYPDGSGVAFVNVYDGVKPVAIAKQFTVISLTNVAGTDGGIAKMYAESLDNGSYDHCTDVKLEIRRDGFFEDGADDFDYLNPHDKADAKYCCDLYKASGGHAGECTDARAQYPCDVVGNDTYNTDYYHLKPLIEKDAMNLILFGEGHSWDLPAHCNSQLDPDDGRYVKFCCADIESATVDVNYDGVLDPGYVKVWLRVWDDANMSGHFGDVTHHPRGNGNSSGLDDDDDYHPEYWADNYNETWGYVKVEVSAPPVLHVYDQTINCDWPYQEKFDEGYFLTDDWLDGRVSATGICDVSLTVELNDDHVGTCPGGFFILTYTATNKDTKGLTAVEKMLVRIDGLNDTQCHDINWPDSFQEVNCVDDLPTPELTWEADPCDLIGWTVRSDTFIFGPDADACRKIVNEYTVIDWCAFDAWHDGQNSYYGDHQSGQFEFEGGNDLFDGRLCADPNIPNNEDWDYSDNGVFKYIEIIKVVDDVAPSIEETDVRMYEVGNNCSTTIQLVNSAADQGCQSSLKWEVSIDFDRDGNYELVYTKDRFGNVLKGDALDFTPYYYDSKNGYPPVVFGGPMNSHNVLYKVTDGCGNVDKEEVTIMIVDKKDPTPYCIHLSSAVMESGSVELWAVDFDRGSFDNCSYVMFTFNEEHPVIDSKTGQFSTKKHYFKGAGEEATAAEYATGDAQLWDGYLSSARVFDCDDLGVTDVRMTVWDYKLNSDWCSVELTLIDNQGACDDGAGRASVSGNIATEESSDVSLVEVTLENLSNPEYELTVSTGNDGDFAFASNPMYNGYDISAVKDGDDTEGVSTLDLVHIQRHILGITPFDSPYKVIAADINSDKRVSGTDLVVLRKTILGIYNEFPTNNSWRFVEQSQSLTVENALSDFNEVININDLDANMLSEDFIAVKIGDVNATAKTNARDLGTQTRSGGVVSLELIEQNVRKGDLVDLTFSSKNFNEVYGYQFTLELDGITLESVSAGSASMTDANIGILDNNTLTVSYSDISGLVASDNMFTLTVRAAKDGVISNMIALTNTALNSEAYVGTGLDINTVELTVNGEEVNSFRLDQNEPNPFDETTVVGFVLPEAGNASLTVYNVAGKVITTVNSEFAQGYNEYRFTKRELNTTGVLYYTLKSGDFTATKKMIIIE